MDALRKSRDVKLGEYGYCNDDRTPCKAYEGHCRWDADCQYGTQCAQRAGEKYGLPAGSSVCIPTYFQHQISFGHLLFSKDSQQMSYFWKEVNLKYPM